MFADAKDLCARGILPLHPYGHCTAMSDDEELVVRTKPSRVAALGGSAELFVKEYFGSGGSDNSTVYLALRKSNGYVLLTTLADHNSQGNDVPEFERFVGDSQSVTIATRQDWWTFDDDALSEVRHEAMKCTLGADGGIRCNGQCAELAVIDPVSEIDCAAVARFDWSRLYPGEARDIEEDWGGRWDEYELWAAQEFLDLVARDELEPPRQLRTITIEKRTLSILEVEPGRWALLHGLVPLLASDAEIRVGPGPGGLFVSSETAGQRRIHRLHLATHELEPVLPGRCG